MADMASPVWLLTGLLLAAVGSWLLSRWAQLAVAVGVVAVAGLWLWLTAVDPTAETVRPTLLVAGQSFSLTPDAVLLLRFLCAGLLPLFLLSLLFPAGQHFVSLSLVALALLALAHLADDLTLAALYLLGGVALLALVVQAERPDSTPVAVRYLLLNILALPLLLLASWLLTLGPMAQTPSLTTIVAVAFLLLLGGFPFFVWVNRLVAEAPLLVGVLVLGLGQTAVIAFCFRLLEAHPWLMQTGLLATLLRGSGVTTALLAGLVAATAVNLRRLLGSLVLLDMGFALLTLTFPEGIGWETAVALLLGRSLSLLLGGMGVWLLEHHGEALTINQQTLPGMVRQTPGMARQTPFYLALFTFGCLSLLGLPLTVGFGGRWVIITAVAQQTATPTPWLAILLLLAIAAGTYGLLRFLAFALRPTAATSLPSQTEALDFIRN